LDEWNSPVEDSNGNKVVRYQKLRNLYVRDVL
jgi:hypothetical protein